MINSHHVRRFKTNHKQFEIENLLIKIHASFIAKNKMYLHHDEEDEKTADPLAYDGRVYDSMRKILDQRSEDIKLVYPEEFIDYLL